MDDDPSASASLNQQQQRQQLMQQQNRGPSPGKGGFEVRLESVGEDLGASDGAEIGERKRDDVDDDVEFRKKKKKSWLRRNGFPAFALSLTAFSLSLFLKPSPAPAAIVSQALGARRGQQQQGFSLPGRQCDNSKHRRRRSWRSSAAPPPPIPPGRGGEQAPAQVNGQARVVRARRCARDEAHVCAGES